MGIHVRRSTGASRRQAPAQWFPGEATAHRPRAPTPQPLLPDGFDKLVVADIIALLIEAVKGIGAAGNKLLQAHTKADHHKRGGPGAPPDQVPPHSAVSDFPIGWVKRVSDVTT